jgi:triosephosphate isomerase
VPERAERSLLIFPPAASIPAAVAAVAGRSDVLIGAQHLHWEEKGAFTGEISAAIALDAGARAALVGHSERRQLFGETDAETGRKVRTCLAAGLLPVLCVGETLDEREAGAASSVVRRQLDAALGSLRPDELANLLIAYEPVWAIGTGRTASPADAAEMHGDTRAFLVEHVGETIAMGVPVLYGGSVKPDNAADLLAASDVDGVLVGGASLDPADFAAICRAAG